MRHLRTGHERYCKATFDETSKVKLARVVLTLTAVFLVLGVTWELYSGVAIQKSGGPSYRDIKPGLYWFEMSFQILFTAVVVWLARRAWRAR